MKKRKKTLGEKLVEKRQKQQAQARRKFLATLSPRARKFAVREFAELGLYQ